MAYQDHIIEMSQLIESKKGPWSGINAESVGRMRLENRFKTGVIDPTVVVTERVGIADVPAAYERFARHEATKILIDM